MQIGRFAYNPRYFKTLLIMAVQKSKVTRSRRGMRRSHDKVVLPQLKYTVNADETIGVSLHHHMDLQSGMYRGRLVTVIKQKDNDKEEGEGDDS